MAQKTERGVLNQLIETCRDGERGFLSAADHVHEDSLKAVLQEMAAVRARLAAELEPHAQRLGGDAAADGSSLAALHRGWIDLKGRLAGGGDRAVLVEVERGDRVTLHAYKDALEGMLPPETRDLVEQQYDLLTREHARIAELEPLRSAAS